jgi:hypothetical protein
MLHIDALTNNLIQMYGISDIHILIYQYSKKFYVCNYCYHSFLASMLKMKRGEGNRGAYCMKLVWVKLLLVALFLVTWFRTYPVSLSLSQAEIQQIGKIILQNECGGKVENLLFWNEAEEFPSLGIGHFIWFPPGKTIQFEQTFPELIVFLKKHADVPEWLTYERNYQFCPWKSRQEFLAAAKTPRMQQLKKLLLETIDLQAEFIVARFGKSLKPLMARFPHIKNQVIRLLKTPGGASAMIDYTNFKGLGFLTTERYNKHGWGLLQVLEGMKGTASGKTALTDFVSQAKQVLTARVNNAPPTKDERRFLPGWFNRLDRYLI